MNLVDPIEPPGRTDKWQQAGGGTVYAPEHPLYLRVPGFWDEVLIGGKPFSKLLCVSFVLDVPVAVAPAADETGRPASVSARRQLTELDPYLSYWYWYPDRIEARYYLVVREGIGYKQQAGVRVFMDEVRRVLPDGSLNCEISFDLLKQHPSHLHVVAWGVNSRLDSRGGQPPTSTGSTPAPTQVVPNLQHTPFLAMLRSGKLQALEQTGQTALSGLHWHVSLDADNPVKLQVTAAPMQPESVN